MIDNVFLFCAHGMAKAKPLSAIYGGLAQRIMLNTTPNLYRRL